MTTEPNHSHELTDKDLQTIRYAKEYQAGSVARYASKRTDYLIRLIAKLADRAGISGE